MKNLLRGNRLSELEWYNDIVDDNCELDNSPKHLPFRFNIDKCNKVQDSWEDKWESGHSDDKYWSECKHVMSILEQSVGKPYADVYSKVCRDFTNVYKWGRTAKQYFKDQFEEPAWYSMKYGYYYIDEEGLIQYYKPERRKKTRSVIKWNSSHPVEYKVNHDEIQNHTALMNTIWYMMGSEKYYKLIDSEYISEKFYNEIKQATHFDDGVYKIKDRLVWKVEYDKNLHKSEYKRVKAEDADAAKKRLRDNKKLREEYKDNLIQYIEWKRKQAIHSEPDEQNRDRHGFDDKSFKKEKEV